MALRRLGHGPRRGAPLFVTAALAALGAIGTLTGAPAAASPRGSLKAGAARSSSATLPAIIHATHEQWIKGFGASGDWWPIDLHRFPVAAQRYVASLLFSEKGIMLSHYRYNIGGGGVGVTQPKAGESELGPRSRAPQSMYVSPGHYDWSHDAGGTTFLRYAAHYHVPDIEANVNSAPWPFTTNGQSCGGQLKLSAIPAYVRYLVNVVRHAHKFWHATLSFVSPMNEPDDSRTDCTQEGMQVTTYERARLVRALGTAFRHSEPYAHVIADESVGLGKFINEAPSWLSVAGVTQALAALATHTYDFPTDATLSEVASLAHQYRKQLWMTEVCCMVGAEDHPVRGVGYDPTMSGALTMAYLIWQDLTYGHMSTFNWWGAASPSMGCDPAKTPRCAHTPNSSGYNQGLLYYDPDYRTDHDYAIYKTKRFWTMGNFSRFIRPGSVLHPVSRSPAGVYLLASFGVQGWRLVAINQGRFHRTRLSFRFPQGTGVQPDGAYRTAPRSNLAPVAGARRTPNGAFTASLPPQSVTTFLFRSARRGP